MPNALNPILKSAKKLKDLSPIKEVTHSHEIHNRLCGDSLWFDLKITDNKIDAALIKADACSLCKASSVVLIKAIEQETIADAHSKINEIMASISPLFDNDKTAHLKPDDPLAIFSNLSGYETRKRCVTLPWEGLKDLLEQIA